MAAPPSCMVRQATDIHGLCFVAPIIRTPTVAVGSQGAKSPIHHLSICKGRIMRKTIALLAALFVLAALSGCAATSPYMTKASITPQPSSDKALVIFMRPSRYGGGIQASVYDTRGASNEFIGIVSAKTKVAYQASPGTHLFMVVGENADFMNADLEAGKTYHVLVSPRMGMWKARFSLLPIHNDASAKYSLKSPDFAQWKQETSFVQTSPAATAWYHSHAADITAKQAKYMQKWNAASAEQKAELTLHSDDGT